MRLGGGRGGNPRVPSFQKINVHVYDTSAEL